MFVAESDNLSFQQQVQPYTYVVSHNSLSVKHYILFNASCTQADSDTMKYF